MLAQPADGTGQVFLDGRLGDAQPRGDFAVFQPFEAAHPENLAAAVGQRVDSLLHLALQLLVKAGLLGVAQKIVAVNPLLTPHAALFPRIDAAKELAELAAAQEAAKAAAAPAPAPAKPEPAAEPIRHEPEVDFETFCRVEMLVGQVTACENMKESKKLLKLTVFDGERERTILSGIAKWYKPEDLAGKKVGIVANLAPRPMMGGKYVSEGMVMAADTADGGASVVFFPDDVPTGMRIH